MVNANRDKLAFKKAVEATSDVSSGYCQGLSAMKNQDKGRIIVPDSKKIDGSLDIDGATRSIYPIDNRWDYAVCYDGEVFYIEVHPASTSDVLVVIQKLDWLKDWLKNHAGKINKLTANVRNPYYWVQSGKFSIIKTSRQYKMAVQRGILPIKVWNYESIVRE